MPKKKGRVTRINELSKLNVSIIIFESPKRILKTLEDLNDIMGDRFISISKEMTKMNEANLFGRVSEVISKLNSNFIIKGEYVIVLAKEGYDES